VGTQYRDVKGGRQVKKSEMQSTDARVEDGLPRNSVDASAYERASVYVVEMWDVLFIATQKLVKKRCAQLLKPRCIN
jgi:hypothetical protein